MAKPYTPSDEDVREEYVYGAQDVDIDGHIVVSFDEACARWDRFLARVRRDAVEQFIEGCKEKRTQPGLLLPPNHWEDIDAAIRVAESYVKNYPEETP